MDQRLLKAFRGGHVDEILQLAEENPDLFRGRTPQRNTTLHLAARLGSWRVVDRILRLEPSFIYERNRNSETPMHIAAKAGNACVINEVEHDNDINLIGPEHTLFLWIKDNQGNIPLHNAVRNHHDLLSVLLIKKSRETVLFVNGAKQSPLSIAIDTGSTYIAWFIMEENPSSLDYRGPNDLTVLHYAVTKQNYVCVVEILRRKKGLVEEVDGHKRNPLHYAAALGNVAIARRLLEADASSSVAYVRDCNGQTPLHLAAKYGQTDILSLILFEYSDAIEVLDEMQRNILHLAALNGKANIVRFVLRLPEMEDLINSPDVDGNTPLHLAALNSHRNVADILSRNHKVNKRATNSNQQTALAAVQSSKDPKLDIQKEENKEMAQVVLVMATLIVTFTFTAALTIPGGFKDKGSDEGTAKLIGKPGFKAFIISITIAMTSAMTAAILALGQIRYNNHERLRYVNLMSLATRLINCGLISMSLAFMTGLFVVLSTNLGLAIAVVSVSCIFPYTMAYLEPVLEVATDGSDRFAGFLVVFIIESVPMLEPLSSVFVARRPPVDELFYPLESTYLRWYDSQIKSMLNSSRFTGMDFVIFVCLLTVRRLLSPLLKSNQGHHTATLELTSTI